MFFVFASAEYSVNRFWDVFLFGQFEEVAFFIGGFVLASVFDLVLQALFDLLFEAEAVFCTLLLDDLDKIFIFFFLDFSFNLLICLLSDIFFKISSYSHGHIATDIALLTNGIQVFRFLPTTL